MHRQVLSLAYLTEPMRAGTPIPPRAAPPSTTCRPHMREATGPPRARAREIYGISAASTALVSQ